MLAAPAPAKHSREGTAGDHCTTATNKVVSFIEIVTTVALVKKTVNASSVFTCEGNDAGGAGIMSLYTFHYTRATKARSAAFES